MLEGYQEQVDSELRDRLRWLVTLRWVAAAVMVGGAFVVHLVPSLAFEPVYILGVAMALGVANLGIGYGMRRVPEVGFRRLRLFVKAQIGIDLAALSVLIYVTGRIYSPFVPYYVFHMIIASILLSPRDSFEGATVAAACIGGGFWASGREAWSDPRAILIALAIGMMVYAAVYLTTSIMVRFRAQAAETRRLADELALRADELRRANEDLEETRQLETRYMRKVAHELRSPLSATISSLQVISQGMAGELTERQARFIGRAEARARQLLKTVDDLLLLIRTRAPKPAEVPDEHVSIQHTLESTAQLLEVRAETKNIDLAMEIQEDLPLIHSDHETVTQVCNNLISNAIKYTSEGGSVRVRAALDGGAIIVEIEDTGIGIPQEDLSRVFDEFFRSSNARTHAAVGTGLGLAIAKSAAESLGGTLDVRSELGVGTTFTLRLPAA